MEYEEKETKFIAYHISSDRHFGCFSFLKKKGVFEWKYTM